MKSGGIFNSRDALGLGETVGFFCTPGLSKAFCNCMQEHVGMVDAASFPAMSQKWTPYCQEEDKRNTLLSNVVAAASKITTTQEAKPLEVKFGGFGTKKAEPAPTEVKFGGFGTKTTAPPAPVLSAPTSSFPSTWLVVGGVAAAAVALGFILGRK